MSWGFRKQHYFLKFNKRYFLYPFLFSLFWGALMELAQLTVFTYRSAEWADFFANTIGATFALLLGIFLWNTPKNA